MFCTSSGAFTLKLGKPEIYRNNTVTKYSLQFYRNNTTSM